MKTIRPIHTVSLALLLLPLAIGTPLHAQELASVTPTDAPSYSTSQPSMSLPDAPLPQTAGTASYKSDDHNDGQTKRILGIIPNFRSVSADQKLPPQTTKDKFVTATEDSFDYSSIVLPSAVAAFNYARNSTPEFGSGGVGYGRYLWHSVLDQTDENYMVEFFYPVLTHEDTRFYTLGHGGFTKRAVYALGRVVITRSDSGKEVFNASEIFGAATAAAVSNAYYPSAERSASNSLTNFGTSVGIDAFTFVFKEFWPDINHYLFHGAKPYHSTSKS